MNSAKAARTICGIGNLGHILINAILRLEPTSVFLNWSLNANDYVLWFLQAVRKNSATFLVYKIRFIYFQCKRETWYFIGRLPKRITRHARSIFNYSAKGHSFYPTCKYKFLTDSAVYRSKPGPNLVIRAGFLIFFFLHRLGGCLFLHRDPARVQAVQKNRNPCTNSIINPIAAVCRMYLFVYKLYFTSQTISFNTSNN